MKESVNKRILAVDPGEARIGIAISDATGTIANPLTVIKHISRVVDAALIAKLAEEQNAILIVVGMASDSEGMPNPAGRRAMRFADVIRTQTSIPVIMWDESGTTVEAREAHLKMGSRKQRQLGHLDDLAATVLLQSYLEAHRNLSIEE